MGEEEAAHAFHRLVVDLTCTSARRKLTSEDGERGHSDSFRGSVERLEALLEATPNILGVEQIASWPTR